MRPVIDSEGIMTTPDLHDGLLLGIILSPDGDELTLLCREVDGTEVRLTVPEIVRLRVDEFLQGNIISDVWIREGDRCPQESVRRVFGYDDEEGALSAQGYDGNKRRPLDAGGSEHFIWLRAGSPVAG